MYYCLFDDEIIGWAKATGDRQIQKMKIRQLDCLGAILPNADNVVDTKTSAL